MVVECARPRREIRIVEKRTALATCSLHRLVVILLVTLSLRRAISETTHRILSSKERLNRIHHLAEKSTSLRGRVMRCAEKSGETRTNCSQLYASIEVQSSLMKSINRWGSDNAPMSAQTLINSFVYKSSVGYQQLWCINLKCANNRRINCVRIKRFGELRSRSRHISTETWRWTSSNEKRSARCIVLRVPANATEQCNSNANVNITALTGQVILNNSEWFTIPYFNVKTYVSVSKVSFYC